MSIQRFVGAVACVLCVAATGGAAAASGGSAVQPYVVMLKPEVQDVPAQARRLSDAAGGQLGRVYSNAIKGFSVRMTPAAAERMRQDPMVSGVEADAPVSTQ